MGSNITDKNANFSKEELDQFAKNFDIHNPKFAKCPYYEAVAHMRKQGSLLHQDSYNGYWAAVGYEPVATAARDWRRFTNTEGGVLGTDKTQTFVPEDLDPPAHSLFRRIMTPFFTRESAESLAPGIRDLANKLIDGFIVNGKVELIEEYATPISGYVFFDTLFKFSAEQTEYCKAAANDAMFHEDIAVRADGFARVEKFAKELIAERKGKPSDGSFIDTIRTGMVGDRAVTDEEAAGCIQLMVVAGGDTAILGIGTMLQILAEKPDIRKQLVADPSLMPQAFEEMVRYRGPSVAIQRTVTKDTELCGQQLHEGEKIFLLWGSANHDETVFENPDEFILNRPNIKKHVAFGAGAHKCIGEWFARTIIGTATEVFLSRINEFEVEPGTEVEYLLGQSFGPRALPLVF